jgi:hypothetical protein
MDDVKHINKTEVAKLFDSYDDKKLEYTYEEGLYYMFDEESKKHIGIDNTSNDAWTEEFDTVEECMNWLTKYS